MIYIIGHIQPDLDSAVAAAALNSLYKAVDSFGYKNTQAVLASPANYETKTIFAKFNHFSVFKHSQKSCGTFHFNF